MATTHPQQSIRERVFYHVRHHDVELAESLVARCPDVESVTALNRFFRGLLSQYDVDTLPQRQCLDDTLDLERWFHHFDATVLPFMRRQRLPPQTHRHPVSPYHPSGQSAAS